MAITTDNAKLLFYARQLGVSFDQTLTIGRLHLLAKKQDLATFASFFQHSDPGLQNLHLEDGFAEPFFRLLGATRTDSLDNSEYEGATVLHDLNTPIPASLKNTYTAVVDAGTLEHVFNFPVALKNCMEALKTGGHFISFTPANNTFGHGFYQFSPELFYRVFCEQNGFKMKFLAVYLEEGGDWFAVSDPVAVKNRVMLVNEVPTHLIVVAEKTAEKEIFSVMPQQSDYQYAWDLHEAGKQNKRIEKDSRLLYYYKKSLPPRARLLLRKVFDFFFRRPKSVKGLGHVNPQYFKKVDIGL